MNIAFKEWASVVEAIGQGRQILLLRKGGIVEARRGFELRHSEFLLFPTFEHQQAQFLKPEDRGFFDRVAPAAGQLRIAYLARVAHVRPAPPSVDAMRTLDIYHVWTEAFLRQRYDHRPDLPLWLIALRVLRLPHPQTIPLRPSYAGCKSWVNLTEEIDIAGATPVLADADFQSRLTPDPYPLTPIP